MMASREVSSFAQVCPECRLPFKSFTVRRKRAPLETSPLASVRRAVVESEARGLGAILG